MGSPLLRKSRNDHDGQACAKYTYSTDHQSAVRGRR
jgi:hypothetical protein